MHLLGFLILATKGHTQNIWARLEYLFFFSSVINIDVLIGFGEMVPISAVYKFSGYFDRL